MALEPLNLDDRNFDELLAEAQRVIDKSCPAWTNRSPSDPGMALLEAFSYLTETMIYRLNRLPEKAYIEFLRLIGISLQPPAAAIAELQFKTNQPAGRPIEIPCNTRVAASRTGESEPIIFATARAATIAAGATATDVLAIHCDVVEGELIGTGTGLPGLSLTVSRPPIVAPTGKEHDRIELDDLVVGIEAREEARGRAHIRPFKGKIYRVWQEVENFANQRPDAQVYVADRMIGRITFAPAARMSESGALGEVPNALAAIPPADHEIRVWYRRGGGASGNVAADTLTVLKDPVAGLQVTNQRPATGGASAETLDNALIRGPQELHSLQRVVTATDFETFALRSGAVARAKALTEKTLWVHAQPGTVRVLLVPNLADTEREVARYTRERLHESENPPSLTRIQEALDERRTLGTNCIVSWARYKTVHVTARVVAQPEEDLDLLKAQVLSRLYKSISPLASQGHSGWRFGEALRASHIYDVALAEPGISYVDKVSLSVDDVPEKNIGCLAADLHQPHTWYVGSGGLLFRSLDNGDGWETIARFPDEVATACVSHPETAGLIAVATRLPGDVEASRLRVSWNCGESWQPTIETAFMVNAMAWSLRDGIPLLFLATTAGLYELLLDADASPVQVAVAHDDAQRGFYAVAASKDLRGWTNVAVAARGTGGVFYSSQGGRSHTFRDAGLRGEDVRVLAIEREGLRSFLWGGLATEIAGGVGRGCVSMELLGDEPLQEWQRAEQGWDGGSCRGLAVQRGKILAASHHKGVLEMTPRQPYATWGRPNIQCGLPLRETEAERLFYPVVALGAHPEGHLVLAGGERGVYRAAEPLGPYTSCSSRVFTDKVTLPPTWLFCSGDHTVEMVYEHGAQ